MKVIKICEEFHPNWGVQCITNVTLAEEREVKSLEEAHAYIIADINESIANGESLTDFELEELIEECEIEYPKDNDRWAQMLDTDNGIKNIYVIV